MQIRIQRGGRKRKSNVKRDDSGKSRGEIEDFAVVLSQPHRVGRDDPFSPVHGYPLGRLYSAGLISRHQLSAGNAWANLVASYARVMGFPRGSAKGSAIGDMIDRGPYQWEGESIVLDDDARKRQEDARARLHQIYDDCFCALREVGMIHGVGNAILDVMRRICVLEYDERSVAASKSAVGNLRVGLNSVDKVLRTHSYR